MTATRSVAAGRRLTRRAGRLAAMARRPSTAERELAEYNRLRDPSELRPWWEYETVEAWYAAFHGYVPSAMAVGLRQLMRTRGTTFREEYARMCVMEGPLLIMRLSLWV